MSIAALTLSLYHSRATYSTRLVLVAIANFEGENGAYPSHDTIGRLAGGLNRRTVQRAIDELIDLGELTEIRRDGITNLYKVAISCPDECDRTSNHRKKKGGGAETAGGLETAGGSGVQTAGGAVYRPHEPVDNHKNNLKRETSLPEDWEPSAELMAMFATKWPDIDPKYNTEQFKLYYLAKGTKHKNWDLTFQRWQNTEQARAKTQPWRAGAGNSEAAQQKRDTERENTKAFLDEMRALETKAAPAPKCPHGSSIVRCEKCLKTIG